MAKQVGTRVNDFLLNILYTRYRSEEIRARMRSFCVLADGEIANPYRPVSATKKPIWFRLRDCTCSSNYKLDSVSDKGNTMKNLWTLMAVVAALTCPAADADIVINELLASTTSTDPEFIELYNTSASAIDISGWTIELWDSDAGGGFGGSDGGAPYTISAASTVASGEFFTLGNETSESVFGFSADQSLPANAIENSSFTIILLDGMSNIVESIFVTDGGTDDIANQAGTAITPDFTIGPDGSFLPAGFFRDVDGGSTFSLLEFAPQASPSATPGASNVAIPEPSTFAVLGLLSLGLVRRKRK